MAQADESEFTQLLQQLKGGDAETRRKLEPMVFEELHRLASSLMRRERSDHTLQTTVLADEAWVQLMGPGEHDWETRKAFFGHAAKIMRHALVDHAKAKRAKKRGGDLERDDFSLVIREFDKSPLDVDGFLDLHECLDVLRSIDERAAQVIELRFFGGRSIAETARILGVSPATVENDFRAARAWLRQRMGGGEKDV